MAKTQVIKCKCGATFSGCIEPYCYTDTDYLKELKKYVQEGCTVEMVEASEFKFQRCTCPKKEVKEQPELFY